MTPATACNSAINSDAPVILPVCCYISPLLQVEIPARSVQVVELAVQQRWNENTLTKITYSWIAARRSLAYGANFLDVAEHLYQVSLEIVTEIAGTIKRIATKPQRPFLCQTTGQTRQTMASLAGSLGANPSRPQ